ncbi:hypothetical protein [Halostagnicola sp. A-GB9-2]|uniref:DUF7525 family protein n=1 Tax=Halostagnicola sp. A-GB9-2 TaxID=3048066 RepID=UPI0024BFFF4A|nr:hypothetical protein [Halostagnicola sp. A-GB9-2]MDJ1430633.1 hypothetical protein [Halostagnicola sp. A-GB9-2]
MTTQTESASDKGVGLTMALSALVVVGAVAMIVGALELGGVPEITAAWGFAGAVAFGIIAVAGIHIWE